MRLISIVVYIFVVTYGAVLISIAFVALIQTSDDQQRIRPRNPKAGATVNAWANLIYVDNYDPTADSRFIAKSDLENVNPIPQFNVDSIPESRNENNHDKRLKNIPETNPGDSRGHLKSKIENQFCQDFIDKINQSISQIEYVELSDFDRCGRESNAVLRWSDTSTACVRYRHPHNFLLAGEILSFYVAELLGISDRVICPALARTKDMRSEAELPKALNWTDGFVVITQWKHGLHPVFVPQELDVALRTETRIDYSTVQKLPIEHQNLILDLNEMIVFDYITGHYDRLASMQDDLSHNPPPATPNLHPFLEYSLRNAAVDTNNRLWLYDNEAGVIDAYSLLFETSERMDHVKFTKFHETSLKTVGLIRAKFRRNLMAWASKDDPLAHLLGISMTKQPTLRWLEVNKMDAWKYTRQYFNMRLRQTVDHLQNCDLVH